MLEGGSRSDAGSDDASGSLFRRCVADADAATSCPGPSPRRALLGLRERNRIGDEVMVAMLRETDLAARATEGNALPGAGAPNP